VAGVFASNSFRPYDLNSFKLDNTGDEQVTFDENTASKYLELFRMFSR